MIIDTLDNASRYYMLHPSLEQAFDFLEEIEATDFPHEKTVLVENHLYVNGIVGETKSMEDSIWESHDQNMDIHFMVEGEERVFYGEEDKMKVVKPYNNEKDVTIFEGEGTEHFIPKNGFVLFFPGEIHKSMVHLGSPKIVKKAVVKLRMDW